MSDNSRAKEGCSLLVRNLRFETSPNKVRRSFEKYGQVRDVYLPLDHYTKKPRGFGFVEFCESRDAREAQRILDRSMLDGNEINVIVAQDRRKSPETMRRIQTNPVRGEKRYGGGNYRNGRDDYRDRYSDRGRRDDRRDRYGSRSRSRSFGRRRPRSVSRSHSQDIRRRRSRSGSIPRDSPRYDDGLRDRNNSVEDYRNGRGGSPNGSNY